ncbi:MAG: gliding motility-associated protein GldE [Bacteroidota bacterium]
MMLDASFSFADNVELIGQIVLFLLLLTGSFMASSSEVAFFAMGKNDLEDLKEAGTRSAQRILMLLETPKFLLATILITNNFVNVTAILVASSILQFFHGEFGWDDSLQFFLEVILITAFLLFFGEIIPKVYAAKNYRSLVQTLALPIRVLQWVCYPLSWVLINSTSFIDKRVNIPTEAASLEDLRHAIDITSQNDENSEDQDILRGIVNFSNITVRSIMRARVDVTALDIETPFDEVVEFVKTRSYSRIPVYEESLDNVKGILHIKDLLPFLKRGVERPPLAEILRSVHYSPENKKIDALMEEFKTQHLHMAIVVDEFGGTAGIVTLEDIIEEIFGEINDEFDGEELVYNRISDLVHIFEGRTPLNDVRKILELEDEVFEDARGDNDSLGGLILEIHGKIPDVGEKVRYRQFELHVESVNKHRITMVKVVILSEDWQELG